ncbi:MAG TPA: hypothetical protein VJ951_07900, partial [Bacteroidales bacterium]|nr:hypothetical protein [Bacteroidales bacterium]
MSKQPLIKSINLLENIKGLSVKKCLRHFTESHLENIPKEIQEQESDASTYLIFSDDSILGFFPNSEDFSVDIERINKNQLPQKLSDVSNNSFWKQRVYSKIMDVKLLSRKFNQVFGVQFILE